ncbi:MAG: DUF1073 domain-containing protein, partial [Spirochaetales bacterium]|nr:DUF1073 domain-containing protein [Spirochaetales bacterium]
MSFPANKKNHRGRGREFTNSLVEMVALVKAAATAPLSTYGTIAYSTNQSLLTLNHAIIAYLYVGNGIFQAAIQGPVQDALSKGVLIKSDELDDEDINAILDHIEQNGLWEAVTNFENWRNCFGGAGLVINTGQDPEKPFRALRQGEPFELYDADRWQLTQSLSTLNGLGFYEQDPDEQEFFNLNGVKIHRSRVLVGKGKRAPWYVRQQLSGWGMSEAERMIRDLNNYLKTQNVLYEILDEAKLDVYHIKNLSQALMSGKAPQMVKRVQMANELKNYLNALVLDAEETYEQRSNTTFTGLADVMNENRIGLAAALRRPMTKLFGLSPAGFSNGDADLDSYFQLVESEERAPLKPVVRKIVDLSCQHLFGFVPRYQLEFPPLKQLSEIDQETIKTQKTTRVVELYQAGLLQAGEAIQTLKKEGVIDIVTAIERGVIPDSPEGQNSPENGGGGSGIPNSPFGRDSGQAKGLTEDSTGRHGQAKNLNSDRGMVRVKKSYENAGFDEGDHPREKDGKFTSGSGSKGAQGDPAEA